jgi:hypothetical protein
MNIQRSVLRTGRRIVARPPSSSSQCFRSLFLANKGFLRRGGFPHRLVADPSVGTFRFFFVSFSFGHALAIFLLCFSRCIFCDFLDSLGCACVRCNRTAFVTRWIWRLHALSFEMLISFRFGYGFVFGCSAPGVWSSAGEFEVLRSWLQCTEVVSFSACALLLIMFKMSRF